MTYFLFSSGFSMSDDCSPHKPSPTIEDVLHKLEKSSVLLLEWYENNYLKPNPESGIYYLTKVLMLETNVFQIAQRNTF